MSDYLFKLNLDAVLKQPAAPTEEERFEQLAALISRRLQNMTTNMEARGYVFEAKAGDSLAMKFDDFAEGLDTSCFMFSRLWDDLCDWGETPVTSGRRDKSLCSIPTLPQDFSC